MMFVLIRVYLGARIYIYNIYSIVRGSSVGKVHA